MTRFILDTRITGEPCQWLYILFWKVITGKKIHPFCTHEGSGLSNTESDIKKSAKGAVIEKGIAIHGSSVDQAKDVLERWIQK